MYQIDLRTCNADEAGRILAAVTAEQIPCIAEIVPRPDPVYGHVFTWPAQEVAQFAAQSAAQSQAAPSGGRP